ncbi:MAG: DUF3137 domain-containing protein [Candidatus Marinimicrobia bacterium]|nr:DUF3137 domain-containing protein [Candidatus Neomarinimicrobiota bacterium]
MQQKLTFLTILLLALFHSCSSKSDSKNFSDYKVSVIIPIEFENNTEIQNFIAEYQSFVNEFNYLSWKIMKAASLDKNNPDRQINEDDLSLIQMAKVTPLVLKQAKLSQKRDALLETLTTQLPSLPENEQRALRGVIAMLDARTGVLEPENEYPNGLPPTESEAANRYETGAGPEPTSQTVTINRDSVDLEKEREAHIAYLKAIGQWEEPKNKKPKITLETIFGIGFTLFILFSFIYRRKNKKAGSTFFQRLSHISSEIKNNYDQIPIEELKNSNRFTEEERQFFEKGDVFIRGLTGEKESAPKADAADLEECGHIVAYENLHELFKKELKSSLISIEKSRKGYARLFILTILIFAAGILSFVLVMSAYYINIFAGMVLLVLAIVLFIKAIINSIKYRNEFKSNIVEKVVRLINPKYTYEPNRHITLEKFIQSKILDLPVNKSMGDDYICGKIDKTLFEFSEFVAQSQYETTDSDGKKVTQIDTLFNGIFFLADFHKHISGETFIVPDSTKSLLGKFGQKFQHSSRGELVKLENPEFEKYFTVFSTSQIEARYILTPTMMEGIVSIRKKIDRNFYLSFIGERVYCGIEFNEALFESSIFRPVRFADIELMYSLFSLIELIIAEMNLNIRIWTKS